MYLEGSHEKENCQPGCYRRRTFADHHLADGRPYRNWLLPRDQRCSAWRCSCWTRHCPDWAFSYAKQARERRINDSLFLLYYAWLSPQEI